MSSTAGAVERGGAGGGRAKSEHDVQKQALRADEAQSVLVETQVSLSLISFSVCNGEPSANPSLGATVVQRLGNAISQASASYTRHLAHLSATPFQVLVTRDEEKRVRRDMTLTKINGANVNAAISSCSSLSASTRFCANHIRVVVLTVIGPLL